MLIANVQRAIERAVPRKPEHYKRNGLCLCGECGVLIEDIDNYCRRCGQKIDWGVPNR